MMTEAQVAQTKVARAELVKRVLIVVTAVLVTAVLIFQVLLLGQVRQTQLEGTPVGQKLLASSDRVLDCTEPSGGCYKRGQEQTAAAVGDINRVIILAAACAGNLADGLTPTQREDQITSCVTKRLSSPKH